MAAEGRDKMATGGASAREMDKMKSRADKAKLAEDAANIQYTVRCVARAVLGGGE